MELLGKCEAQYANNLVSSKRLVLRTDRDRGDNPFIEFYSDAGSHNLLARIYNTVHIENMDSSPSLGAKNRTDIHFNESQLDNIRGIITPFIDTLAVTFDDAPKSTPDPTGMEYPGGMPLGVTKTITWIPARVLANYADNNFSVEASKIYIDAEHYSRGNKYHLGASMSTGILHRSDNINSFELIIPYNQLKRFLHTITVAKMWFK